MTNKEYAANLLVEAAGILNSESNAASHMSINEEAAYINDLSHRIDIMCEYAINVIPYETDTMTEGIGSVAKAAFEKMKKAAKAIWEKIKELYNKVKSFFKKIKGRRVARRECKVPSAQSFNTVVKKVGDLLGEYKMNHSGTGASGRYDEETIKKINGEIAAEMSRTEDYIKIAKGSELPNYESQLETLKTYAAQINKLIDSTNFNSRVAENHERRANFSQSERDRLSAENKRLSDRLEAQKGLSKMYLNAANMHNDRANRYFDESFMLRQMLHTLQIINKAYNEGARVTAYMLPEHTATDHTVPVTDYNGKYAVQAPRSNYDTTKRTTKNESAVLESLYSSLALCESTAEVDAIMKSIEAIESKMA